MGNYYNQKDKRIHVMIIFNNAFIIFNLYLFVYIFMHIIVFNKIIIYISLC